MEFVRNCVWCCSQVCNRGGDCVMIVYSYKFEKNWKLLYMCDVKFVCVCQLGFIYLVFSVC